MILGKDYTVLYCTSAGTRYVCTQPAPYRKLAPDMKLLLTFVSFLCSLGWTECAVSSPIVIGKHRRYLQIIYIYIERERELASDNYNIFKVKINHAVPGILGNQLEGKLNNALVSHFYCRTHTDGWTTMWLSLTKLLYPEVFCLSDYMK